MVHLEEHEVKVLNSIWFCGRSNVGIVKVRDPYEGIKYYIGFPPHGGHDEAMDAQWIADWGSTFPVAAGEALFNAN